MRKRYIKKTKIIALDFIIICFGTAVFALGVHVFTAPNHIAPGGVTGLSTILNYLIGIPIGTTVTIINIPLLFLGYKFMGKSFFLKTLVSTLFFSVIYDFVYIYIPVYKGNSMLAGLFGGVLIGAGLAIVFMRGGSTGGTDITNKIIQQKMPYIPLGRLVFLSDLVIISIATIVFHNIESALYAVITMFVASKTMDTFLYGYDMGKMVFIITQYGEDVSKAIISELKRGATILSGKGAYTSADRNMIVCAVRKNEFYKVKRIVNMVDPTAFMMVTDAGEVLGEGFKPIKEQK